MLPSEIQLQIWKHALPEPRSIQRAILFIIDLDLDKTRAILPSSREAVECYHVTLDPYDEGFGHPIGWELDLRRKMETAEYLMVLALFHTCRASRLAARNLYRLNIESIVEGENDPLWRTEDLVCFLPNFGKEGFWMSHYRAYHDYRFALNWLVMSRDSPPPSLSSLQHFAIFGTASRHWHFDLQHLEERDVISRVAMQRCVKNLPSLQSITLLLDPNAVVYEYHGRMLLDEPKDQPIEGTGFTPARLLARVSTLLKEQLHDGDDAPVVKMYVARRSAPGEARSPPS